MENLKEVSGGNKAISSMSELILVGTTLKNSECYKGFSSCTTKARYLPYDITDSDYRGLRVSDRNVRITESFGKEKWCFFFVEFVKKTKESSG